MSENKIKKFKKIYIEITNICNLQCSFCPGHNRPLHSMSENEFITVLDRAAQYTNSIFFHLMGEPTLHPLLPEFIAETNKRGLKSILTTNGCLLGRRKDEILSALPYRVNISLHSFEANSDGNFDRYFNDCMSFAKEGALTGIFCIFRLWNNGGEDKLNDEILKKIEGFFGNERIVTDKGYRIADHVFVEFGDKFDWQLPADKGSEHGFCLGLRDQIGILSNGNVVPCCLDNNSEMTLGNIFENSLPDILSGERAKRIIDGFSKRIAVEEKCKSCGYRNRFD